MNPKPIKHHHIYVFAMVFFTLLFIAIAFGAESNPLNSPSALVPEARFEFEPVPAGVNVTHSFVVKNQGTAPLNIEKVRAGWGCNIVSYTRQIPPGGEGTIVIKVKTYGYGGKTLTKRITVQTNDPNKSIFYLTLFGHVDQFVTIIPKSVTFRGTPGTPLKETVRIIPEKKYPFKIIGHNLSPGNNIRYELEQVEHPEGAEYVLSVENLREVTGHYDHTISLKTDSNIQPLLNIHVKGYIQDHQPQKTK